VWAGAVSTSGGSLVETVDQGDERGKRPKNGGHLRKQRIASTGATFGLV